MERVSPGARALLERHPFPGNVRELKNIIDYAFVIGDGPALVETDLPPELSDPDADGEPFAANVPPPLRLPGAREPRALGSAAGAPERLAQEAGAPGPRAQDSAASAPSPEAARILRALERASGSRDLAARSLGISRVTLWRKMRALGLVPEGG